MNTNNENSLIYSKRYGVWDVPAIDDAQTSPASQQKSEKLPATGREFLEYLDKHGRMEELNNAKEQEQFIETAILVSQENYLDIEIQKNNYNISAQYTVPFGSIKEILDALARVLQLSDDVAVLPKEGSEADEVTTTFFLKTHIYKKAERNAQ